MKRIRKMSEGTPNLPKLLCVDDDETVLSAVIRLLRHEFEVLQAPSGERALEILEREPDIAIILTDHRMGGMSGLELLTKVQEKAPDMARVVFSGHIALSEMADAINSSRIHRFIYKPWNNEYLRLQMLEAFATHLSLKERRVLESMSVTDSLTQTKNRRYFQDRLRAEIERSQRHGRPLTLVMADIDHFKVINDEYGHPAGDEVLRNVAAHFTQQLRSIDTIARYGGEEFAMILPDTGLEDALKVAERVRTSLGEKKILLEGGIEVQVTLSLGVACHPQNATTTEGLVAKADAHLYQAKRSGRNQTVGAP